MNAKDVSQGSLTAEQVAEYTDALTRHYGEPVRPVSHYCEAFRTWHKAILDKLKRIEDGTEFEGTREAYGEYYQAHVEQERDLWTSVAEHLAALQIPILKSNLLARLIYGGEKLRTKPCPEHRGQWSGCAFGPIKCGCGAGANVTGWLAESPDDEQHHVGGPIPMVVAPPDTPLRGRSERSEGDAS